MKYKCGDPSSNPSSPHKVRAVMLRGSRYNPSTLMVGWKPEEGHSPEGPEPGSLSKQQISPQTRWRVQMDI